MGQGLQRARRAARKSREISSQDFILRWWAKRFPQAEPPGWNSAITCAYAVDLLDKFRLADPKELKKGSKS